MDIAISPGTTGFIAKLLIKDSVINAYKPAIVAANLNIAYSRDDDGNAGATVVSLSTGIRGTWSSGGFIEKDATNSPGEYEFGIPNTALVSGSKTVIFTIKDSGSNNIETLKYEIQLASISSQLADSVSHGGSSAILALKQLNIINPDGGDAVFLSATSAGSGLYIQAGISGAGILVQGGTGIEVDGGGNGPGLTITSSGAGIPAISAVAGGVGADGVIFTAGSGGINFDVGGLDVNLIKILGEDLTGNNATLRLKHLSIIADDDDPAVLWQASGNTDVFIIDPIGSCNRGIYIHGHNGPAVQLGNGTAGAEALVLLAGTVGGDVDAIRIAANGTGHDINLTGSGDINGNITVNGLTTTALAGLFTINSTKTYADAIDGSLVKEIGNIIFNTTLTEDYAVASSPFTLSQALYEICQTLEERTITGSTLLIKKRDGTTEAFTINLDSPTPTTQSRS